MKRFLRKIFKRKPKYEPAGTIHYGEFRFGDYYAKATPHGSYHVWHHDKYLGERHGERIEVVEQLLYSAPQNVTGSPQTGEQHHN